MGEPYDYGSRPFGFRTTVPLDSNGTHYLRLYQQRSRQRLLSKQLSLGEAQLTAPRLLPNGGPQSRRHHSDDAIESHQEARASGLVRSFSNIPIRGEAKAFQRQPTNHFNSHERDEHERPMHARASDLDDYRSNMESQATQLPRARPKIIRDVLSQKPGRQVVRQYYELDNNCDSCEQYQEHASQQFSSRSMCYEQQSRRPIRSQSVRHFESFTEGPTDSNSEYRTERKAMPQLARSMSEQVLGERVRASHGPILRTISLDEDCEQTIGPRSLAHTANNSLSAIGHSAHARSSASAVGPRGNAGRGGLRAQASLRSISETRDFAGDGLSDVTGDFTGSNSSQKNDDDEASINLQDTDIITQKDEQHGTSFVKSKDDVPMITPQQTMRVLSFGRLEKAVEVSPGIYMRLRDARETWDAIEQGHFVKASCGNCDQATIYCIDSASFVSCPSCKHITEIDGQASSGGGVGLGFTPSMFRTCNLVGSRSVAKNVKQDRRVYR